MLISADSHADTRRPEVSVIVTSFQRPQHLRRSLRSIRNQQSHKCRFEVVVADDGSWDETFEIVAVFAASVDFPVTFTTHEHQGFCVAKSRNNAISVSRGSYLLFIDGDCLLPLDHLAWHLRLRRPAVVVTGDSYRLTQQASRDITFTDIDSNRLPERVSPQQRRHFRGKALRGLLYGLLRVPMRPRLTGNNFGIWRSDIERINGFDEAFVGWGLEDTDVQRRLSILGMRFSSILHRTIAYHLWHPPHSTMRRRSVGTENYKYYHRHDREPYCRLGLVQSQAREMTVHRFSTDTVESGDNRGRIRPIAQSQAERTWRKAA
jgi:glycosyltransferase involved in cell wall biosynthesis